MRSTIRAMLSLLLFVSFNVMALDWTVGGNNLTGNGTIGANNKVDMIFETNNATRGRLTGNGLWGFGAIYPAGAKVHISSANGQDALKVQVGSELKLFVDDLGGTSIGGPEQPPSNGLLVAGSAGIGGSPGSYKAKITHGTFGFNIENATTLDDWELWVNSGGLTLYSNGNFRGNFNITTGAYTSVSDERVKTNIQAMPSVLDKVNQLKPSTYQFHQDGVMADPAVTYGFIAQDVAKVFPHLVEYHVDRDRGLDAYTMDYSGFGVLAIKAIQELQQNVNTLEARVVELEAALGRSGAP